MLHIVDDEEEIRDSLLWLASSRNIAAVTHESGEAFLAALEGISHVEPLGECVLLDVRMPSISGIALFDTLKARDLIYRIPVIFMTGHGDVPMAVDAIKRGAFDFFEKPFDDNKLMDRIQEALAASLKAVNAAIPQMRLATLSPREREVLDLILAGNINKVIADKLFISTRTVEVHRAHIFEKMKVKTAMELATLLQISSNNINF
ncbi:two component transcriptional regulator, LuxR family [Collimonas sp. OK307]|uniref:response regulator transcription factor n=1 Tax=Collimonas sp. OK307 TaxID=1801620 RepID=UPI0008F360A2|nr:response regulator [Collimonas sp. OK307]SFH88927.1 two component transcriptional regulator, LuxR family [Collimonas sp. OK307]